MDFMYLTPEGRLGSPLYQSQAVRAAPCCSAGPALGLTHLVALVPPTPQPIQTHTDTYTLHKHRHRPPLTHHNYPTLWPGPLQQV